MHSALRWVALVLLVLVVAKAWAGRSGNRPFTEGQKKLGLFTMVALHLQLVLGLLLYMMGGWIGMLGQEGTMTNSHTRFFAVEHITIMLVAIVLGTLGHSLSKRARGDQAKNKKQALFFGLCLLLVLAGIPWPFRAGFEQVGWF